MRPAESVRVKEIFQRFARRPAPPPADPETAAPLTEIPAPLVITRIENQAEFQEHRRRINAEVAARREQERELSKPYAAFPTSGFCFVCQRRSPFLSTWELADEEGDHREVNWREHLRCRHCRLNNRMRASIHLLMEVIGPTNESHIYATEQSTPLYRYLHKRFPLLQGSEYMQKSTLVADSDSAKLHHEDLTHLSFPNASFDVILSFDVFEHIPDYPAAFAECARTLKPTGKMLFSVPFDANAGENLIRAKLREDGTIEHLHPAEYHCDPRDPEGCLCFQHFAWQILEQMKKAGFARACALSYYSREYGYLGGEQMQFLAEK